MLTDHATLSHDRARYERGYAAIGLYAPKFEQNIGGAIRAACIYGASLLAIQTFRFQQNKADPTKGFRHFPVQVVENLWVAVPYECVPVAVEFIQDGIALPDYQHPQRAFYIFGPENGTLGHSVLSRCRDIVFVPTVACMNLAATVNVVLYDRMAKQWMKNHADR